jgi:hypothetical protein
MDKLKDKNININNYGSFEKGVISKDGKSISFSMACGVNYRVSLDYFLKWFSNPHYTLVEGELLEWEQSKHKFAWNGSIAFAACERILSNTALRVSLSNGAIYDVPWDTVLMACEEKYEHFGGLTSESKQIVNEWYKAQKG